MIHYGVNYIYFCHIIVVISPLTINIYLICVGYYMFLRQVIWCRSLSEYNTCNNFLTVYLDPQIQRYGDYIKVHWSMVATDKPLF